MGFFENFACTKTGSPPQHYIGYLFQFFELEVETEICFYPRLSAFDPKRAHPVCAPKRHTKRLKNPKKHLFWANFQACAIFDVCTYWGRSLRPKSTFHRSQTYFDPSF